MSAQRTAQGRFRPVGDLAAESRGHRLAARAAEAAEVRGWQTNPDVVALRIEQVRTQVDRLCWAGVVLGLAFTMTNVQQFAAGHAAAWSLPWLAAWVLDPTVSVVLVALLRAEQVTARYQVPPGRWVRRAKWLTLTATYVMNSWQSYARGDLAAIVLHSVPPLVVFAAAEAITEVRDQLTEAVTRAHHETSERAGHAVNGTSDGANTSPATVNGTGPANGDAGSTASGLAAGRTSFAEYLADGQQAWTVGIEITPAWVRQVTGCSRGMSPRLARALTAWTVATDPRTGPAANNPPDVQAGRSTTEPADGGERQ